MVEGNESGGLSCPRSVGQDGSCEQGTSDGPLGPGNDRKGESGVGQAWGDAPKGSCEVSCSQEQPCGSTGSRDRPSLPFGLESRFYYFAFLKESKREGRGGMGGSENEQTGGGRKQEEEEEEGRMSRKACKGCTSSRPPALTAAGLGALSSSRQCNQSSRGEGSLGSREARAHPALLMRGGPLGAAGLWLPLGNKADPLPHLGQAPHPRAARLLFLLPLRSASCTRAHAAAQPAS